MFRQESTQRDDLGGGGGRDVKHPNTASPQDPPFGGSIGGAYRIMVRRIAGGDVILRGKMTGRGKPLPYRGAVFFAPSLRGLSADQADWGSVLLKNDTPSVFACGEATSLREGGNYIAALRRCHFARQNDRTPGGSEGSAAGGRYRDPSEWQRSVFSEERRRRRKIPGTATGSGVPTGWIGGTVERAVEDWIVR